MLGSLAAHLLPGAFHSAVAAQAYLCASSSRLLSHAAASTSSSEGDGLPFAVPEHEIEDGLPVITARLRAEAGSNFSAKLRRARRTPGQLFSLPGERSVRLDMATTDAAALVRNYGRNGLLARVLRLELQAPDGAPLGALRVLPKGVHITAATQAVENLKFMFLPRERRARVPVPVALWGEEGAPGVKGGGWLHVVNRTVPFVCEGWAVVPRIELDVRRMQVQDVIRFSDVPPPPGCALRVKDPSQPVVRCAAKVGGE